MIKKLRNQPYAPKVGTKRKKKKKKLIAITKNVDYSYFTTNMRYRISEKLHQINDFRAEEWPYCC
jgi:hypothetical protein